MLTVYVQHTICVHVARKRKVQQGDRASVAQQKSEILQTLRLICRNLRRLEKDAQKREAYRQVESLLGLASKETGSPSSDL